VEIALYCPSCQDRVHRKALTLSFDEIVTCPSCAAKVKGADMLTDDGKTLLDYLALLTLQRANSRSTFPGPASSDA
jgi:hypothetical protein